MQGISLSFSLPFQPFHVVVEVRGGLEPPLLPSLRADFPGAQQLRSHSSQEVEPASSHALRSRIRLISRASGALTRGCDGRRATWEYSQN